MYFIVFNELFVFLNHRCGKKGNFCLFWTPIKLFLEFEPKF